MAEILELPGVKARYVLGMSWRHEDAPPKAKAMRAMAVERGYWGVVYTTSADAVQAGFCIPVKGVSASAKLRPLAAVVGGALPPPWNGLYDLGDGRYWFIAVRDGQQVIPDGDQVGTLDEMEALRNAHRESGVWNEVDGGLQDLVDIVSSTAKQPTIRNYGPAQMPGWLPVAGAIGVATLLIGGGVTWYLHAKQLEAERIAREQAAALAAQAAKEAADRAKHAVLPWSVLPLASEALGACAREWDRQSLAKDGWVISGWECAVQEANIAITASWISNGGLASAAPGVLGPTGRTSSESRDVPQDWSTLSSFAETEDHAKVAAWSVAKRYGIDLNLEKPPAAPTPPGKEAPPPPPWSQISAPFAAVAPPWLAFDGSDIETIPGYRVTSIGYKAGPSGPIGGWEMRGALYSVNPAAAAVAGKSQ